jgi:FMN phosphatase YigB (HAD superfamily)
MRQWIFLDVGGVLLDEAPLAHYVLQRHFDEIRASGAEIAFNDFLIRYEIFCANDERWPLYQLTSAYLSESECTAIWCEVDREVRARYHELVPPAESTLKWIDAHANRSDLSLGIIANQPIECRAVLESIGIMNRFEIVLLSEEIGLHKPDGAIFERALDLANTDASRCVMIGDRLDNDIVPAQKLGMRTVWHCPPARSIATHKAPRNEQAQAHRRTLDRIALGRFEKWEAGDRKISPTWIVRDSIEAFSIPEL